jgi:hypothetical protein
MSVPSTRTVTPWSGAPPWEVTVPVTCACWADAVPAKNSANKPSNIFFISILQ